ncbi:hypothetical protein Ndes2526B_g02843 [Nannochloris sp. 'desiccata']|nr:putative Pre-mRNA-processing protein 40C [Chlorella desiccata (nom. nud.)]
MSSTDPASPEKAKTPPSTNHSVVPPPFRPPGPGAFMPPHRPPWGPPPAYAIHPTGTLLPPGYFPPYQAGARPRWDGGAARPFPQGPPQHQPRPVSSKPIAGTDWLEVTNDNGTKFWHNIKTSQGVWQKPAEVVKAARAPPPLDAAKLKMLERARASGAVIAPEYKAAGKGDKNLLLLEGGRSSAKAKGGNVGHSAVDTQEQNAKEEEEEEEFDVTFTEDDVQGVENKIKAKGDDKTERTTAPLPPPARPPPSFLKDKDAAIEAEFRALLKENAIHGFSRYEKELPKLQIDSRFGALLPPERRRAVFEDYCSKVGLDTKSEEPEKTKEKKQVPAKYGSNKRIGSYAAGDKVGNTYDGASKKPAEGAFKALLQERVVRPDVRWYRVKDDLKKDSRFGSTSISEQRKEDIFTAHIESLWKLEEARERAARRTHHAKHAGEERQRYAKAAAAEQNFKVLLGEAVRDQGAEWDSTWQRLQRDPQGRATDPMLDKHIAERMFRDHVAELKAAKGRENLAEEDGGEEVGGVTEAKKGMDPAYARAYLEGRDAKRPKIDT